MNASLDVSISISSAGDNISINVNIIAGVMASIRSISCFFVLGIRRILFLYILDMRFIKVESKVIKRVLSKS